MGKIKLEICVDSFESAMNAQMGGADRIELCSALSEGGLTPSFGLVSKLKDQLSIPIHVLIRPRNGNFVYTEDEIQVMIKDIQTFRQLNVDGFVFGVLNENQQIDHRLMLMLLEQCGDASITFHRAIDVAENPVSVIEFCIVNGVDRILTSGKKCNAEEGLTFIKEMIEFAGKEVSIMPGAGIDHKNIEQFLSIGIQDIHMSLRKNKNESDSLGFANQQYVTDEIDVKQIRDMIDSFTIH